MRITSLYDIKHMSGEKKKLAEEFLHNLEQLAETFFEHNEFDKFQVKIKLVPIERYQ